MHFCSCHANFLSICNCCLCYINDGFCLHGYSNQPQNNDDRDRSRERDRNRRSDRPTRINSASRDRSRERNDRGGRKASDRRIYVSNIPYDFRWQDLKDLFRTEVGKVAHVELFTDENDKPRGCGIVEFEDSDSVKIAVEKMHRYDIKGRKLVVKEVSNSSLNLFTYLV